ncbi:MAG: bis(5'-nucleosyl)-tetraphosphatase (symmetrical) YqeK [Clostridium sp.]|nr:bis(5'-nucleosyl)-tetraphosphatase (symmetrical) YqeK [Clostridium sp.]MCM1398753.1 bis(5'-nucleosyl)-tetraphosphatase (symmetrical) YqeK [Clostridium sp.]MCM1458615.1 bis(5'-nucleosyl)-tetraphosphatase (symmetrical) YqeK [Bacteroides sp.]
MTREKMLIRLKGKINEKRFEHSLGVEYTAAALAMVHGANIEKARLAGLLHDCAKGLATKEKLEKARKHNIPINKIEEKNPDMLHAKLGAFYAKYKYDVDDEEILSAIAVHTTGKPNMTLLEKIIFVADYIEPNRKSLKDMEEIRKEAFTDLDQCIVHILQNTLIFLEQRGGDIDYMSKLTYNYYVNNSK